MTVTAKNPGIGLGEGLGGTATPGASSTGGITMYHSFTHMHVPKSTVSVPKPKVVQPSAASSAIPLAAGAAAEGIGLGETIGGVIASTTGVAEVVGGLALLAEMGEEVASDIAKIQETIDVIEEGAAEGVGSFSPINSGPLASDIANTFRSATYEGSILSEDTTLYRVISDSGNPNGAFWSRTAPSGPLQSIIDLSLDPSWGNTATKTITRTFPTGTQIFEGAAAPQGGLVGGGNQVYIPGLGL